MSPHAAVESGGKQEPEGPLRRRQQSVLLRKGCASHIHQAFRRGTQLWRRWPRRKTNDVDAWDNRHSPELNRRVHVLAMHCGLQAREGKPVLVRQCDRRLQRHGAWRRLRCVREQEVDGEAADDIGGGVQSQV